MLSFRHNFHMNARARAHWLIKPRSDADRADEEEIVRCQVLEHVIQQVYKRKLDSRRTEIAAWLSELEDDAELLCKKTKCWGD
jgi:hypothetical protein